ncbi:MAG: tetratricopeptide repeat protein [Pirellulaceae bacterium]|nr:tetratricopeptide repeat protein [Pirellulaceae bacterium]
MSTAESSEPAQPGEFHSMPIWLAVLLLTMATLFAYRSSFRGVFLFDDTPNIVENERIQTAGSLRDVVAGRGRPLLFLSLALNFRWGGLNPFGYHLFNLAVHLTAGLALFGVVRRTLLTDGIPPNLQRIATELAFASALLWLVHPLQTGAVTYIVQRCEAMMGMFFLLCLNAVIRGATTGRGWPWYLLALVFAAGGTGSKEVMVTAAVVVPLYDRIFLSRSWRELLVRRGWVYAGLMAMAAWLIAPQVLPRETEGPVSAGFHYDPITPWEYLRSQPGVILHYLRLAFWPDRLCLDYGWPVAHTWTQIVPPGAAVLGLLLATVWALWRFPRVGFLGAAFFLILAPTSSIMPIADLAFEHRMYLPLAAVITLSVLAVTAVGLRVVSQPRTRGLALPALLVCAALALTLRTIQRNRDYHDPVGLWNQVIERASHHDRGWYNAGLELLKKGEHEAALPHFRQAIALNGRYVDAYINVAICLGRQGDGRGAVEAASRAIAMKPDSGKAYYTLGMSYAAENQFDEAAEAYQKAIALNREYVLAYVGLGNAYARSNRLVQAVATYRQALDVDGSAVQAWTNLGQSLVMLGRHREAAEAFRRALQLNPNLSHVRSSLAWLLATCPDDSVRDGAEALRLARGLHQSASPDDPGVLDLLAAAYAENGQYADAVEAAQQAVRAAQTAGRADRADAMLQRLRRYEQNQPYRE